METKRREIGRARIIYGLFPETDSLSTRTSMVDIVGTPHKRSWGRAGTFRRPRCDADTWFPAYAIRKVVKSGDDKS